mmetsp:Transcript_11832/g.15463  ORF Transcript_11832/g.15463 Transcript_11832/m.15463 type:complete len:169 (+) Transcript_11832:191-697(+)|eukprot:CAMPEP_0117744328 /NCGR_PEP_ID=MMETSP0947-20121206/6686_1 /TAXON_ID=44440 /ORGANISM="Chattonella subsalsa, Strain CCMP2191" /LENGTH=168 /DNA_ID=CAMNT_0005561241 /DNA_START=91 /DNA_END=597 /DNA_ORIENTATION=+
MAKSSNQDLEAKEHRAFFAVLAAFAKGVPAQLTPNQIDILGRLLEALNIQEKIKRTVKKMLMAGEVTKASRNLLYEQLVGGKAAGHKRKLAAVSVQDGFDISDGLDILDVQGKAWSAAQIKDRNGKQVMVHYHGWNSRWDEWIDITSKRLAPPGTHVKDSPFVKKMKK